MLHISILQFHSLFKCCTLVDKEVLEQSPQAAVGSSHHVVKDVEGGLGLRSSGHPQLLQQHRLSRKRQCESDSSAADILSTVSGRVSILLCKASNLK